MSKPSIWSVLALLIFSVTAAPLDAPSDAANNITGPGMRTPYICFDAPTVRPLAARLDYKECQASIDAFTQQYPPGGRWNQWHLTHQDKAFIQEERTLYCPVTTNPDFAFFGCDFVFDYRTYPGDRDTEDELTDVKDLGESLIRKCTREGKFYGGNIRHAYGSFEYLVTLRAPPITRNTLQNNGTMSADEVYKA